MRTSKPLIVGCVAAAALAVPAGVAVATVAAGAGDAPTTLPDRPAVSQEHGWMMTTTTADPCPFHSTMDRPRWRDDPPRQPRSPRHMREMHERMWR